MIVETLKRWFQRVKQLVKENPLTTVFLLAATGALIYRLKTAKVLPEIRLNYLIMALKNNMVEDVVVQGKRIYFVPVGATGYSFTNASVLSKDQLFRLLFANPNLNVRCQDNVKFDYMALCGLALSAYLTYFMVARHGQPVESVKKDKKAKAVKFDDIYGHEDTKRDLREIIDYLKHPQQFKAIGARLRRGVLLYGPSGTGKTMLAKAVANEAGVNFLYMNATEFLEVYVGVGPKRVRELFEMARQRSPCIVFLDELDAVGKRFTKSSLKDNYETNATINQLLVEMDGFEESDRVVVIAASNREKFIETALLRSGRFDLKIKVDLPNRDERAGILRKKLEPISHNIGEADVQAFGRDSDGLCGADIDTIVNETIMFARRDDVSTCEAEHLRKATAKVKANIVKDET